MKLFFTSLFCLFILNSFSQTKVEVEKSISISQVPKKAQNYISDNYQAKKVKWISEKNNNDKSIEAKFCYKKEKYSVEFGVDGALQDIEIIKKIKKLDQSIKTKIKQHLNSIFLKYRILKVQIQYLNGLKDKADTNYELIVLGKTEASKSRYEITYNFSGDFKSKSSIKENALIYLRN